MLRFVGKIAVASLFALLLSGCEGKEKATITKLPVTLRLSEVHAKGYPTAMADEEFARLVEENTQGRVKIEVRTGGALAENEIDAIEALKYGDLAFARVSAGPVASYVPKLNAIQMPYLYRSSSHMWNVLNSSIGQGILEDIERAGIGLIGLCFYDAGSRNFYSTKPIYSVSDMEGLKIRVQSNQMMIDMCSALGAEGVVGIGMAGVRSAIANGVIDAAENNWPTYQNSGDYTVAPYYIVDQHTRVPEILLASKKALERVSDADMEIIKQAAKQTQEFEIEKWKEKEQSAEQIVKANGNTVIELSSSAFAEFQSAMQPLYDTYGKGYESLINEIRTTN